jgi:fructose-specific phosphotransferase system IIA component
VGLDTNVNTLFKFSLTGFLVAIIGLLLSFFTGLGVSWIKFGNTLFDSGNLFLGIMCAITAVGITSRILAEKRQLDSPEGITIMEGAVLDDAVGMILLALTLGLLDLVERQGHPAGIDWMAIGWTGLKSILLIVAIIVPGLLFANKINTIIKRLKNKSMMAIIAFAFALLVAGIFEFSGLAMVIGAYMVGLILSKTDFNVVIKDNLKSMHNFFIPAFFTIMGMMIDIDQFLNPRILFFGLVYSAGAIISKFIGCSIPSLMTNFNLRGATRIGLGMIPRGEIVLVVAGLWLSSDIIDNDIFTLAMFMTMITTLVGSSLFSLSLRGGKSGVKKSVALVEKIPIRYEYPDEDITELFIHEMLNICQEEGYYVHAMKLDAMVYQIEKGTISVSLYHYPREIIFKATPNDSHFVKTLVYESYVHIANTFKILDKVEKPQPLDTVDTGEEQVFTISLHDVIVPDKIIMNLQGTDKREILEEMIDFLAGTGDVKNRNQAFEDVFTREQTMSTGLQNGIAIPHAKTRAVSTFQVAMGIHREGVDFAALDGQPSRIFIMILAPRSQDSSYLQVLSNIARVFIDQQNIDKCLAAKTPEDVCRVFADLQP